MNHLGDQQKNHESKYWSLGSYLMTCFHIGSQILDVISGIWAHIERSYQILYLHIKYVNLMP